MSPAKRTGRPPESQGRARTGAPAESSPGGRPSPQFRPRKPVGGPSGGGPRRRFSSTLLLGALIAVVLVGGIVAVLVVSFTSGGDDDPSPSGDTSGEIPGPEPIVEGPAARYVIQLGDLPASAQVHVESAGTYPLTPSGFAQASLFTNTEEGDAKALEWDFIEGFQTEIVPDGGLAAVLQGSYYSRMEVYLFSTQVGARLAYDFIRAVDDRQPGSDPAEMDGLGNAWAAYSAVGGTVGPSDEIEVYHRVVFRRGNAVVIVQTTGAQSRMDINFARGLAHGIDQKLLGLREAPTPTPAPSTLPILPPTATATAAP